MWTFESLVQASPGALEQTLVAAKPPDFNDLDGYAYDGFNCASARAIPLPARKFRKVFFQKEGAPYGLNQFVSPDNDDWAGEWRVRMENGKPVESGFFRVGTLSEAFSGGHFAPYQHLIALNYNVDPNPRWNLVMRSIYDLVGLPNEDDYSVVLGKAYLRLLPGRTVFATYFVLGHRSAYGHI